MKRTFIVSGLLVFLSCIGPGLNPGDTSTSPIDPGGGVGGTPTVGSFSPTIGPMGTTLTIQGESFATGVTVTVGEPCGNVMVVSTTELTCTLGANSPGEYDVVVDNPGGEQQTATGKFTSTAFLYVNGDEFRGYRIAGDTGTLTSVGPATPGVNGTAEAVRHPTGKFLFVHSQVSGTLFAFSVNPETGVLTAAPGGPFNICATEGEALVVGGGKFVAIACPAVGAIRIYPIDTSTGAVGSEVESGNTNGQPVSIATNADGSVIYYTTSGSQLKAFNVNASTGELTDFGVSQGLPSSSVTDLTFVPDALFFGISAELHGRSLGDLSAKSGSPWSNSNITDGLVATAAGDFLFTISSTVNRLRGFSWNGLTLTEVSGSPFTHSATVHKIGIDPGGNFVFTQSEATSKIYTYTRDASGALVETGEVDGPAGQASLGSL